MSNQFLCRGKRIYDGVFVAGFLVKKFGELSIMSFDDENTIYPIIPETVGQYTGKTDCYGNRAFIGDIIVTNLSDMIDGYGIIYYDEDLLQIRVKSTKEASITHFLGETTYNYKINPLCKFGKNFKIIGNIYDNKLMENNN